ncbi:MAG: peptidoglycan DD-metalloendopeptidase family protein [Lachnospiraceae bacterium]|nr:peptidoglycan DD-metalloendopeptidase family protein [Lachnospiraceae bacterium]
MMGVMTGVMIQAAVLVTAILIVRKLSGEKLHAYVRYSLWLLVALRLLIPVNLIDSPFSLLRAVHVVTEGYREASSAAEDLDGQSQNRSITGRDSRELTSENERDVVTEQPGAEGTLPSPEGDDFRMVDGTAMADMEDEDRTDRNRIMPADDTVAAVFRGIWIVGSMVVGGIFFTVHLRFRRRLYRARKLCQQSGDKIVGNGRKTVGLHRNLPIYQVKKLEAPCLVGVLRPAIYVGTDIRTGTERFRHVVTHEQVHYLHGDHIWALLRAVLVTVYWFHPFVWVAAAASVRDGEIACDHGTIKQLGEGERLTYGEMLLELSRKNRGKRVYSFGTMLRPGRSEMKERIMRLAGGNGTRMSAGILAAVLMLGMAGCTFTGGAAENAEVAAEVPADSNKQRLEEGADGKADLDENPENDDARQDDVLSDNERIPEREPEAVFDPEEEISEARQLTAAPAQISEETELGVDGPWLDYAGKPGMGSANNSVIIFHDYFGLVVYDLTDREVVRSLDLAAIGCNFTQGDNTCQVAVSADGREVWLHPMKRQYMFHYDVEKNLLRQLPIVKSFEVDLETQDLFDRYLVTEERYVGWRSNYLYEEYKDERGLQTAYIYLYASTSEEAAKLRNLQCVWDDMVYTLWDGNQAGAVQTAAEFPYQHDGNIHDVEIIYDEPCVYSRISDTFGERTHSASGEVRMHEGIDFAAEEGADIKAAADGIVHETGYTAEYGNYVVLLHQNGDMTYYCHCKDINVSPDEQIERGDTIATVGRSGRATGFFLHFALSRNGEFVDPAENMSLEILK